MIFRQSETIAFMRRCKAKDFFAKLSLIWSKLGVAKLKIFLPN
jgi:hypothetical protein